MNWGYKIMIAYILFVGGIAFLAYKAVNEKTDLVVPDYYEQELKFQQRVESTNRSNALTDTLQYELKGNQLLITFPVDFLGKKIKGDVMLYCPSDKEKDIKQPLTVNNLLQTLTIPENYKGLFELQVSWEAGGLTYYFAHKIFIE